MTDDSRFDAAATEADGIASEAPSDARWNSRPDTSMWLARNHLASADAEVRYRIHGWLAERGTSVWFGAGSTGKTQLMLWMAASIASLPDDRPGDTWLGGRIEGTGHVLVLTAEDTRDQIVGRLKDVLTHSLGQGDAASRRTSARLHVMPFLSLSEKEFAHDNPSLFYQTKERNWEPTEVLKEVRRYIARWNSAQDVAENRIVGVVMDSATSMSGFDSLDAQATTNFFFYLGRLCERLEMFWAIIGHTPKSTTVAKDTYRATAPSRLRGVAMWTTAPRLTVEVRLVQDWTVRGRKTQEAGHIRDWLGDRVDRRDLLVVYVAKANLKNASMEERYLVRQERGAFVDVTDRPDRTLLSGALDRSRGRAVANDNVVPFEVAGRHQIPAGNSPKTDDRRLPGRPRLDAGRFETGTAYLMELIREAYPDDGTDRRLSADHLMKAVKARRDMEPRAHLIHWPSGGGRTKARAGGLPWHLEQLEGKGILEKRGRRYYLPAGPGDGGSD